MESIYLDYNATTPIDPAVAQAMLPYIHEHFGNPSSGHIYGVTSRKAVQHARKQIADLLGSHPEEIVFTSGGSESNNHAIKGVAGAYKEKGNHIITSSIEHPAVTEVCRYLEEKGFKVTYIPVDEYGLVDPRAVKNAITPETILITIMHANNEVGAIQPIVEIAGIAKEAKVLLHTDAAQSLGKIPVRIDDLGVDLLSIAGHKLYGPKGIGALFIRSGIKLEKLIHGADHEINRRAGTENVIGIVGLGKACELVSRHLQEYRDHQNEMKDLLQSRLISEFPYLKINGHPNLRLPNTLSVSFPGMEANTILAELQHVAASAGAACHSDQVDISHVLEAMKVPVETAMGTIRFSVGRYTSTAEIDQAVEEIKLVVQKLKPDKEKIYFKAGADKVRLTKFTHGLGCACKMRPQLLEEVLRDMPIADDKNVLVGIETADDAGVYRLDNQTAVVQTVDFFTPVVDDPCQFGAIAAANSLSDIYAMGGKPLFGLNIVAFPGNRLPVSVLRDILKGASDITKTAGVTIIGGHTVDDNEPKFGLAITGVVHPGKILTNRNARKGDKLILTKPLGTGILSTALKQDMLDNQRTEALVSSMISLNKNAAEVLQEFDVSACTDVTGFGLLGHLLEMMNASDTSALILSNHVPLLQGTREMAAANIIPGGSRDNRLFTTPFIDYNSEISETVKLILNDAQTSGGLLIAVERSQADKLLAKLHSRDVELSAVIGEVQPKSKFRVYVK